MRIVMMGTGTFAEPTFEALIAAKRTVVGLVTQPDREGVKVRGSTRQTGRGMTTIAQEAGIPIAQPQKINTPEGLAALRDFAPDLLVVAAYGQILSRDVIALPPLGAVNVHASLLPKYRGASPIAHAILAGETQTGVTIIRITLGLDAGDMLAQESVDIGPEETTGELEARLAPLGARLCVDVLTRMDVGPVTGEKQDPALVTKAPKLAKEQGQLDWSLPAEQLVCHVRAMQPWPTAYTFLHRPGKEPMRIVVCRCSAAHFSASAVPGDLLSQFERGRLLVRTGGDTCLEILELQPAGKKRMTAEEFLRGYPIQPSYKFGSEK